MSFQGNDFHGKKVVIVGAGKSGICAANLLTHAGADIILFESNIEADVDKIKKDLTNSENINIILGHLPSAVRRETDLLVLSPGVPVDLAFINEMADNNIPVWGEIELAYAFSKGKIVGITGTNGKTTTTALTGHILKEYYKSVFVVGNIGIPYTKMVLDTTDESVTVIELSSFQLETIHRFRPDVSMILNITPDHLNRHHTMENYIGAKEKITMNQNKEDVCILNYEDEVLRNFGDKQECKVMYFSSEHKLEKGIYLDEEEIYYSDGVNTTNVVNINELQIIGKHNYENAMAAIASAIVMEIPMEIIKKAVKEFRAVEHRIEYVATKNGVKYYNDSKGTNPDAAIQGIKAMRYPTVLIGGGYDKGADFEEWIEAFDGKVKKLILIGQTADKIAKTCDKMNFKDYVCVKSLEDAMVIAKETAQEGDCVLLSPACASWGMFKNYEERGRIFKELVNAM